MLDFAILLLKAGAEVEHSLLVQYLYAAYSINEVDLQDASDTVLRWKTDIRLIAREEMAHLVTVQNLLLAVNQPVHLNRGHLHDNVSSKPLPFVLEPLSVASLAKYVVLESPSDDQLDGDTRPVMIKAQSHLNRKHNAGLLRVGLIYAVLYWLFLDTDTPGSDWPLPPSWVEEFKAVYGPGFHLCDCDFIDRKRYEERAASSGEWGIYESNAHVGGAEPRELALNEIRWIMSQGEGPNAIERSHFVRFVQLFREFRLMGAKVRREVVFNVPTNPVVRRTPRIPHTMRISDPRSLSLASLLNVRYQLLLLDAAQSLSTSRKTDPARRRRYADWAVREMEFIKKIGQILPHCRLGSKNHGRPGRAAAPFETTLIPVELAKQTQLRNRLIAQSGGLISELGDDLSAKSSRAFAAMEPGLLESISNLDDEMSREGS